MAQMTPPHRKLGPHYQDSLTMLQASHEAAVPLRVIVDAVGRGELESFEQSVGDTASVRIGRPVFERWCRDRGGQPATDARPVSEDEQQQSDTQDQP